MGPVIWVDCASTPSRRVQPVGHIVLVTISPELELNTDGMQIDCMPSNYFSVIPRLPFHDM